MRLTEENGYYEIDCSKAVWATDEHHKLYHDYTAAMLSDVDWIIETRDKVLFVEYKNGKVYSSNQNFNPCEEKNINKVAKKYYDSLHYTSMMNKNKKIDYIYVLEFPGDDKVTRSSLKLKIAKKLPFRLQNEVSGKKLINDFSIVSINEWNENYPDLPITRTDKPFK